MENVIVIHLESINMSVYSSRDLFANIYELEKKGVFFTNYYSSATSTIMTMSDLIYGDTNACENTSDLKYFNINRKYKAFFEDEIFENYNRSAIIYPCNEYTDSIDVFDFNELFHNIKVNYTVDYDKFKEKIDKLICQKKPFCGYIYDYTSLGSSDDKRRKIPNSTWMDRNINGFRCADNTVGVVIELLKKYNKLEDTLIVLFGDHGDDLWTNSINNGFTHAIEPNPALIKTPLIIYDGKNNFVSEQLLSSTDIREIIINHVKSGEIQVKKNEYIFCRNLYKNQKSNMLKKGYFVSDGNYYITITQDGIRMGISKYESYSHRNLLDFFYIKKNRNIKMRFLIGRLKYTHINCMLYDQKEEIANEFTKLCIVLEDYLNNLGLYEHYRKSFKKIEKKKNNGYELVGDIFNKYYERAKNMMKFSSRSK